MSLSKKDAGIDEGENLSAHAAHRDFPAILARSRHALSAVSTEASTAASASGPVRPAAVARGDRPASTSTAGELLFLRARGESVAFDIVVPPP
jgi:hypothetical protein